MRYKFLLLALISTVVVAGINKIASMFYLYWTIGWFDNLVHFLGGFTIGLFFIWICFVSGVFSKNYPGRKKAILYSVVGVLIVGIGWEIFEYVNGLTQSTESYSLDVAHDLISDILGAIIAGDIGSRKKLYPDLPR